MNLSCTSRWPRSTGRGRTRSPRKKNDRPPRLVKAPADERSGTAGRAVGWPSPPLPTAGGAEGSAGDETVVGYRVVVPAGGAFAFAGEDPPVGALHRPAPPEQQDPSPRQSPSAANGARVHRPSDAVSGQPATPDQSKFVPWPSDFFRYLSALHGVKVVSPPRRVRVGGVRGTQVTIQTPPMHPIIWLKGDHGWIGGGASGVDPASTRQIILLDVKGKKLLLVFADTAARFKSRWPLVLQLLGSIQF